MTKPGGVSGPAFHDAAIAAAGIHAHFVWREESIKLRDSIKDRSIPEILGAIDDEIVRAELLPSHRRQLLEIAQHRMAGSQPVPATPAAEPEPPPIERKASWLARAVRWFLPAYSLALVGALWSKGWIDF